MTPERERAFADLRATRLAERDNPAIKAEREIWESTDLDGID